MARKAVEAWGLGATEVCIQGGLPRDLPKFYYRDILRAVKTAVPQMHRMIESGMRIRGHIASLRAIFSRFSSMDRWQSEQRHVHSSGESTRPCAGQNALPQVLHWLVATLRHMAIWQVVICDLLQPWSRHGLGSHAECAGYGTFCLHQRG